MSKVIKEYPKSKRFFPGLLPIIGDEKYKLVSERYQSLLVKHRLPKNPALQHHLIEGILPGLALYQILREGGETQESALAIIDHAFGILFSKNIARMKTLGRLFFIFPILRIIIKPAMRQYPPQGWLIEWVQNDKNAIRFNMNSCFYFDILSQYDASELTTSFCRVDDLIYGTMSPYIKWQRLKTIAKGGIFCDFCFYAVKRNKETSGISNRR